MYTIHMHMYTNNTHTCTMYILYIHVHIHVYKHTCTLYMYSHNAHTCIYMYTIHIHVYTQYTYMYMYTHNTHRCTCICTCINTYVLFTSHNISFLKIYVHVHPTYIINVYRHNKDIYLARIWTLSVIYLDNNFLEVKVTTYIVIHLKNIK